MENNLNNMIVKTPEEFFSPDELKIFLTKGRELKDPNDKALKHKLRVKYSTYIYYSRPENYLRRLERAKAHSKNKYHSDEEYRKKKKEYCLKNAKAHNDKRKEELKQMKEELKQLREKVKTLTC